MSTRASETGTFHVLRSASSIAAVVVLAAAVLMGCGDPFTFRDSVGKIVALEQFGGAFARLYSTPGYDEFTSMATEDDIFYVAGYTEGPAASQYTSDAVVLRIKQDGTVLNQMRVDSADLGIHYDEAWGDIAYAYRGGSDDRVVVGGWRHTSGPDAGVVMTLRVTSDGLVMDTITGLDAPVFGLAADDGGYFAVGAAQIAGEKPFYAYVPNGTGNADYVSYLDSGGSARLTRVVKSDNAGFVAVGQIYDVSDFDVLVASISPASGTPNALAAIDTGGDDYGAAIARFFGPELFVVVAETHAYFGGERAWLIVLLDWTTAPPQFVISKAWALKVDPSYASSPHAVYAVDRSDNYWGIDGLFAVSGDGFQTVLMDTTGEIVWASELGDDSTILNGNANAIVPNGNSYLGFLIAGTNPQNPDAPRGTDGALAWALPGDGTAYPETSDVTDQVELLDVTNDITMSSVALPVSTLTLSTFDDSVPASQYTIGGMDGLETIEPK